MRSAKAVVPSRNETGARTLPPDFRSYPHNAESEVEVQRHLNLARAADGVLDDAEAGGAVVESAWLRHWLVAATGGQSRGVEPTATGTLLKP